MIKVAADTVSGQLPLGRSYRDPLGYTFLHPLFLRTHAYCISCEERFTADYGLVCFLPREQNLGKVSLLMVYMVGSIRQN